MNCQLIDAHTRIAVIGGGKMGEAILGGWISSQADLVASLGADQVIVAEPGGERRAWLQDAYGVSCVAEARDIPGADIVVLSVKPQVMMDVLEGIKDVPAFAGQPQPLFVSIAAGLPTSRLLDALPVGARLVRVMPNTPLLVGKGAAAVCASATSTAEDVELVRQLFACLGSAYTVDESDMDAVCALSGSGPAYVAAMVEALRDAGIQQGLDAQLAEKLALSTVHGTCELMIRKGQTPESTRVSVCSPGGTTLAALDAMNEAGFAEVFSKGVAAAVERSKELAAC